MSTLILQHTEFLLELFECPFYLVKLYSEVGGKGDHTIAVLLMFWSFREQELAFTAWAFAKPAMKEEDVPLLPCTAEEYVAAQFQVGGLDRFGKVIQ